MMDFVGFLMCSEPVLIDVVVLYCVSTCSNGLCQVFDYVPTCSNELCCFLLFQYVMIEVARCSYFSWFSEGCCLLPNAFQRIMMDVGFGIF